MAIRTGMDCFAGAKGFRVGDLPHHYETDGASRKNWHIIPTRVLAQRPHTASSRKFSLDIINTLYPGFRFRAHFRHIFLRFSAYLSLFRVYSLAAEIYGACVDHTYMGRYISLFSGDV